MKIRELLRWFRFKSIKNEMLFYTSILFTLVIILLIHHGNYYFYRYLEVRNQENIMREAEYVASRIEKSNLEAVTIAEMMAFAQQNGLFGERQKTTDYLKTILNENQNLHSAYTCYEPNADQQDSLFIETKSANETGRFLPYWYRQDDELILETTTDMESNLYYWGAKEKVISDAKDKSLITEPYLINNMMMVEHSYPLVINGAFVGVVGVNRTLKTITDYLAQYKPYETADFVLVSRLGSVISATFDPNLHGQKIGEISQTFSFLHNNKGMNRVVLKPNPYDQHQNYFYASAYIETGEWLLIMQVSEKEVFAPMWQRIRQAAGVGALSSLITIALLYWILANFTRPVKDMMNQIALFASGDLTVQFNMDVKNEFGQMSEDLNQMVDNYRGMIGKLNQSSDQLTVAAQNLAITSEAYTDVSEKIATQIEDINQNIQNVSSIIEKTAVLVDSVSSSAESTSLSAHDLAARTGNVAQAAKTGGSVIEKIVEFIQIVTLQTDITADKIKSLDEETQNIGEIVQTMSAIATQTNLLALNAAIEAARAKEEGRGFAVVAEEVGQLAAESKVATNNIADILETLQESAALVSDETEKIVDAVKDASGQSGVVSEQFQHIMNQIEQMAEKVSQTASIAQTQSASSEEMSTAMMRATTNVLDTVEQINAITEGIRSQSRGALQIETASQELNTLAKELDDAVKKFKL